MSHKCVPVPSGKITANYNSSLEFVRAFFMLTAEVRKRRWRQKYRGAQTTIVRKVQKNWILLSTTTKNYVECYGHKCILHHLLRRVLKRKSRKWN